MREGAALVRSGWSVSTVFRALVGAANDLPAVLRGRSPSVDDLRLLVASLQQSGALGQTEARIVDRALGLHRVWVGEYMTPRTEVRGIPMTATLEQAVSEAIAARANRLVVHGKSLDEVLGFVDVRDLLATLGTGATLEPGTLLRPVLWVPATRPIGAVLEEMRSTSCPLTVVVDEYGGTAGVAALEQLLEALVGRMAENAGLGSRPRAEPDGSLVLNGFMHLDDFVEITGVKVDGAAREEVDTLGGLVMASLGRIPREGDEVTIQGRVLRVETLEGRRVATLRLLPLA